MDMRNLTPAHEFARQYGFKAIVYGGPGTGKTPIVIGTPPRPLGLLCEAGVASLKGINTPCYPGFTAPAIDEFFEWFFNSNEAKAFDTLGIDSTSQMMQIYVDFELSKGNKSGGDAHGKRAYGQAAAAVMKHITKAYFLPNKHFLCIAKEQLYDMNGIMMKRPIWPGQQLNTDMPHFFDLVLHMERTIIPGVMGEQLAIRCRPGFDVLARDRTGILAEHEPPNFSNLIAKMSG